MRTRRIWALVAAILGAVGVGYAQEPKSSYMPVVITESVSAVVSLALELKLVPQERADLVAFMRAL
jgi:hypothetical protein